ncbi:hypothetical protein [Thermodesulfovibrio sp. TK110]
MKNKKQYNVFADKKRLMPKSIDRLAVFTKKQEHFTIYGSYKLSKPLSQTDRDIFDAIAATGVHGEKDGQKAYLFDFSEVLRFLGHKNHANDTWLKEKLKSLAEIVLTIKTERYEIIGHIVSHVIVSYKPKNLPKNQSRFRQGYLALIVFSKEFSKLYEKDYIIWATPKIVKAIIDLPHDFLKAIVRFCLTHEEINMTLESILELIGYSGIQKRYYRKIRKTLIEYAEYFWENFAIKVVKNNSNGVIILYKKNSKLIAIDYKPE